ncbi:hypothetical protein XENOCAPTIV_021513 [Xenoophorus captivus]|uniref:Uncharacterized protein n=1 Tax=Xenoophorus captivus TaxID=1517983 RepID=A0ABV0RD23_9TELE
MFWYRLLVVHLARLYSLQADPATYCNEPDGEMGFSEAVFMRPETLSLRLDLILAEVFLQGLPAGSAPTETAMISPVLSPSEEPNTTLSVSSDSVSLPTQVEVQPLSVATELTKKLNEVTLEDVVDKKQEEQKPGKNDSPPEAKVEPSGGTAVRGPVSKQPEIAKEDGPQDLRVFELNSDSGKSTPSNNGKKGTVSSRIMLPVTGH